MNSLSDKQLQTLKNRLIEEKNELQRHFEINGTSGETLTADTGGELSVYDFGSTDVEEPRQKEE